MYSIFSSCLTLLSVGDVVSSFDSDYRLQLIRVLKKEFSDFQLIVLTHDRTWFEQIVKETSSKGWKYFDLNWTDTEGISVKRNLGPKKANIEEKLKNRELPANELRKFIEDVLKELCCETESRLAFTFNDRNEDREASEYLNALRGKIKSHHLSQLPGAERKICEELFENLNTALDSSNKGSHSSTKPPEHGDLKISFEDAVKLEDYFLCADVKCNTFVSVRRYDAVNKLISCRCKSKSLLWKD